MRRYSNSTIFSPATVRLIPNIDAPPTCIQCSSICLLPPGCVCHAPEIHERSASVGVWAGALAMTKTIASATILNIHDLLVDELWATAGASPLPDLFYVS